MPARSKSLVEVVVSLPDEVVDELLIWEGCVRAVLVGQASLVQACLDSHTVAVAYAIGIVQTAEDAAFSDERCTGLALALEASGNPRPRSTGEMVSLVRSRLNEREDLEVCARLEAWRSYSARKAA